MTAKRTPRGTIDLERALTDDDDYAEIHRSLRGPARDRFERAVDALWRARQPASTTSERH